MCYKGNVLSIVFIFSTSVASGSNALRKVKYGTSECNEISIYQGSSLFFAYQVIVHANFVICRIIIKMNFSKKDLNSLNPDKARHFVGSDLGPN